MEEVKGFEFEEINQAEEGNFFKGIIIALALSVPMWTILLLIGHSILKQI